MHRFFGHEGGDILRRVLRDVFKGALPRHLPDRADPQAFALFFNAFSGAHMRSVCSARSWIPVSFLNLHRAVSS